MSRWAALWPVAAALVAWGFWAACQDARLLHLLHDPPPTLSVAPHVEGVWTGHSYAFILTSEHQRHVALVDTGSDPKAQALSQALARTGHTLTDVDTVILTHGHVAHTQGLMALPHAQVYVAMADAALLCGLEAPKRELPKLRLRLLGRPTLCPQLLPALPGERLTHGAHQMVVVALPGHTRGSLGLVVGGGLIAGDALMARGPDPAQLQPLGRLLNDDADRAQSSAAHWRSRVAQSFEGGTVPADVCCQFVVDGHSGHVVRP